jgi:hypothetical protein
MHEPTLKILMFTATYVLNALKYVERKRSLVNSDFTLLGFSETSVSGLGNHTVPSPNNSDPCPCLFSELDRPLPIAFSPSQFHRFFYHSDHILKG